MTIRRITTEIIRRRFQRNIERCQGILDSIWYSDEFEEGYSSEVQDDLARALVVYLHASLEDLLRTILIQHYRRNPTKLLTDHNHSKEIPDRAELWKTLSEFESSGTVETFIDHWIRKILGKESFSNQSQVAGFLKVTGFTIEDQEVYMRLFEALIQRRHDIVHNADLNPNEANHEPAEIDLYVVEEWMNAVQGFGEQVIGAFDFSFSQGTLPSQDSDQQSKES